MQASKKTHIIVILNSLASSRSFLLQKVFEISMSLGFAWKTNEAFVPLAGGPFI